MSAAAGVSGQSRSDARGGEELTRVVRSVSQSTLDEVHREVVELLEVVTRVRDLVRFKPEPSNGLEDLVKVDLLLCLRVRVVVAEVAVSTVVLGVAKVDSDRFRVSNLLSIISTDSRRPPLEGTHVEETIGLRRESSEDLALGSEEMLDHPLGVDLLVLSRLVQSSEPSSPKDLFRCCFLHLDSGCSRSDDWLGVLEDPISLNPHPREGTTYLCRFRSRCSAHFRSKDV